MIYIYICKLHHTCTIVDFMAFQHVWPENSVGTTQRENPEFVETQGARVASGLFFLVGRPQVATSDRRCREMGVLKNDKFDTGHKKYLKYMIQDFDKHGLSSEMGFIL